MESNDEGRMPRPVAGIDMRKLPIGPQEAFVLTRVDGRSSETEIAAATGIDRERVRESLGRLAELGAIEWTPAVGVVVERPPVVEKSSVPPHAKPERPAIEAPSTELPDESHPAAALYDPAELDEVVDLDLPRKRRILDFFYRLDTATHYELLGVSTDADKKAIKSAYFQIVTHFHPDRYFGKSLGTFKPKLERVFQRLTEAHEVLTRSQARAEYDRYLASQRRARGLEKLMSGQRLRDTELEEARRQIERAARLAERASHNPQHYIPPPPDPEIRKKALARKLRSMPPRMTPSPEAAPTSSKEIQAHVAEELKRRFEARLNRAKEEQVNQYSQAANEALERSDLVSAANALRIAVTLSPDDAELKVRFEEVQDRANSALSETYLEQARYEEQTRRFLDAAASYERVARTRPGAEVYDRAASCVLEGDGDMRRAVELARKALAIDPDRSSAKLTLAKIYAKAGMKESALAEFERLSQLAPDDDTIKDWIRRVKRGEV